MQTLIKRSRRLRSGIVVVRPDFETATKYGQYYEKLYVIGAAEKNGIPYVDLYGADACKAKFRSYVSSPLVVFISGTGHGNPTTFTGQNYEYLLVKGYREDAGLMKGKWGSFLSCSFGQSADWWVEAGMLGFFGYNRTYYFMAGVYPDSRAKYFYDSHHAFNVAVLNGCSWRDAFNACKAAYDRAMVDAPYDVKYYLKWDRDSMVVKGAMDDGPFVRRVEPNWWCRFLKWLCETSGCPGKICGGG